MRNERARGQAMLEFTLIIPIFMLALLGLLEFGRAVYSVQILDNAAREGARYAIVHGSAAQCVNGKGPSGPMPTGVTPPACWDSTGANVAQSVRSYAIAILQSQPSDFTIGVKWCATTACTGTTGDGNNGQGETVQVTVNYAFHPLLAGFIPLPAFTLTGVSNLVINY